MGNGKSETEKLEPTNAESENGAYELKNNVLTILPDSKKRKMMGVVTCYKDDAALGSVSVTGKPIFASLPNALTNLDQDNNKRIECQVMGYPIPTVSWKFQAIEKEVFESQCADGACKLCEKDCDAEAQCTQVEEDCIKNCSGDETKCSANCKDQKAACTADFYNDSKASNSTDLFGLLASNQNLNNNIAVRYANVSNSAGCPMNGDEAEAATCKVTTSMDEVNALSDEYKPKSQLFFSTIEYTQGGKYVCFAEQVIGEETYRRSKDFIWRVKDPMAALWPFLALVAEVVVVVCIILYYERASQKGENKGDAEEGDEFIENKKEES